MRICRFLDRNREALGFYSESCVLPLTAAAEAYAAANGETLQLPEDASLLDLLPPDGPGFAAARRLARWCEEHPGDLPEHALRPLKETQLLVPVPRPGKLLLLAGNYARHIEEGGGRAAERAETFPYVFLKPPSTTLTDPGQPICLPAASPDHIDWELELAVVIGRRAKAVKEGAALDHVAGYLVVNDISDRQFRPNPTRKERPRDAFFDWLHGKWHDSFCPCGPCIASADAVPDPQSLKLELRLNGELRQDASTSQQIFPVAAIIEFISSITTLEVGDIISTGTPHGVGSSTGTFLKPGDRLEASIGSIGTLVTPVVAEDGGV